MALKSQSCPKCGCTMKPGYPLETAGEIGNVKDPTLWIDGIPKLKRHWLGGESLAVPTGHNRFVLGFCCENCGYIELYAVNESDARYHAAQPERAPDERTSAGNPMGRQPRG